eukprot:COSAG01_NODE_7696_length_3095_cov_3.911883_1_plen_260_part_00
MVRRRDAHEHRDKETRRDGLGLGCQALRPVPVDKVAGDQQQQHAGDAQDQREPLALEGPAQAVEPHDPAQIRHGERGRAQRRARVRRVNDVQDARQQRDHLRPAQQDPRVRPDQGLRAPDPLPREPQQRAHSQHDRERRDDEPRRWDAKDSLGVVVVGAALAPVVAAGVARESRLADRAELAKVIAPTRQLHDDGQNHRRAGRVGVVDRGVRAAEGCVEVIVRKPPPRFERRPAVLAGRALRAGIAAGGDRRQIRIRPL